MFISFGLLLYSDHSERRRICHVFALQSETLSMELNQFQMYLLKRQMGLTVSLFYMAK